MPPHFRIPLNLPHAGTLARRLAYHLNRVCSIREVDGTARDAMEQDIEALQDLLLPHFENGENPPHAEAGEVVRRAAERARALVEKLEAARLGDDRFGQVIRNLFECLELGEEGARQSLRAGENPDSALRPE
ncbi:MAG: hypothetical protein M5U26_01505 [Planctomycetota bacterium]|nr:hypothetical protein [Planctomycetota bacterium]